MLHVVGWKRKTFYQVMYMVSIDQASRTIVRTVWASCSFPWQWPSRPNAQPAVSTKKQNADEQAGQRISLALLYTVWTWPHGPLLQDERIIREKKNTKTGVKSVLLFSPISSLIACCSLVVHRGPTHIFLYHASTASKPPSPLTRGLRYKTVWILIPPPNANKTSTLPCLRCRLKRATNRVQHRTPATYVYIYVR